MVFVGIIMVYAFTGSTDLLHLTNAGLPEAPQLWLFPLVFVGFGILAGLWPFHTWAPTGHVAAPTAASMLLAGVVMKLGAYGCLRVALPLFPAGLKPWDAPVLGLHSWPEVFALLAVIGIVYGGLAALAQGDFKFVIGYSSVSHMGFVLLGMVTFHRVGLAGSVLQMFSHGIIAGLLFAVVGRMVYDRTHTRDLAELRGFELNRVMPFAAGVFIIAALAGMGLPGFSGFVAELQVLIGSWHAYPTLTLFAGAGIVVAVAYSLRAIQQGFFKNTPEPETPERGHSCPPLVALDTRLARITLPERIGAGILIVSTLVIGLFPGLLLRWIVPALESPYFEKVLKGGGQ
jgi:NADH-quinone oxidoreductase subunit M